MATNYPTSLDTTTELPASGGVGAQLDDFPHSTLHGNINDAVRAIETELGTNPSGAVATVKARMEAIEANSWVTTARINDDAVTDAKVGAPSTGSLASGGIRYARMGNIVYAWTTSSTAGTDTFPAGFRPAADLVVPCRAGDGTMGSVGISTAGVVSFSGGITGAAWAVSFSTV